jgi:hypothetical protein
LTSAVYSPVISPRWRRRDCFGRISWPSCLRPERAEADVLGVEQDLLVGREPAVDHDVDLALVPEVAVDDGACPPRAQVRPAVRVEELVEGLLLLQPLNMP